MSLALSDSSLFFFFFEREIKFIRVGGAVRTAGQLKGELTRQVFCGGNSINTERNKKSLKTNGLGDFSDGPVVKTLCFNCRRDGIYPFSGTKILLMHGTVRTKLVILFCDRSLQHHQDLILMPQGRNCRNLEKEKGL